MTFEVWIDGQPEPAFGDPSNGGSVSLPPGYEGAGYAGWYAGHLGPGGTMAYDHLFAGAPIPISAPSAPTNVTATPGNGSAAVSWSAPNSNGSDIQSYAVTAVDSTTPANGGQEATGTGSPLTVAGLTNGDQYAFTVTATNGVGTGPPSAASNPVVPESVPSAPSDVSATPGNGSAAVSWSAPNSNGSAIQSYTVTAVDSTTPGNGGQEATGVGSPVTVSGLTNGDGYTFTVTATNGVGTGPPSAASSPVVPASTPDSPVAVIAAPDGGDDPGILIVSFTPQGNEGSAIVGYEVTVTDESNPGDPSNGSVVDAADGPVDITGLTSGDTYSFTVVAVNGIGPSGPSGPSGGVVAP